MVYFLIFIILYLLGRKGCGFKDRWRIFRQKTLGELVFITGLRQTKLSQVFPCKSLNTLFHVLKGYLPEIFSKVDLRPTYACTVASFKPRRQVCDVSFGFLQRYRINSICWGRKFSCTATFRKDGKSVINRGRQSNRDDKVRKKPQPGPQTNIYKNVCKNQTIKSCWWLKSECFMWVIYHRGDIRWLFAWWLTVSKVGSHRCSPIGPNFKWCSSALRILVSVHVYPFPSSVMISIWSSFGSPGVEPCLSSAQDLSEWQHFSCVELSSERKYIA